jgi:hypothetical protein
MKKQLNVATITNELRGQSAFFPTYKGKSSAEPVAETVVVIPAPPAGTPPHPVPPVRAVPPVPPGRGSTARKRVMKQRHPFDIYQDQYEALRKIALEERKQGGVGSMSAMVREALDQLIAAKRKPK